MRHSKKYGLNVSRYGSRKWFSRFPLVLVGIVLLLSLESYTWPTDNQQVFEQQDHHNCDSIIEYARDLATRDLDSAKRLALSILNMAKTANDPVCKAGAYNVLGGYYYETGLCDSSIYYYREAMKSWTVPNLNDRARFLIQLSNAYMCLDDYESGFNFADSAFRIASKGSDSLLTSKAAVTSAVNLIYQEHFDSASPWMQKGVAYASGIRDTNYLVTLFNNYGLYNRDFGSKDTGRVYLNKAINIARAKGMYVSLATIYLNYGQDLQDEDLELCKAYLDSALSLSRKFELHDLEESVLGAIAVCYRDTKQDVELVGDAYEKWVDKIEYNIKRSNQEQFAELEVKYKTAEKEAEALALAAEFERKSQRQRLYTLIAILGVLISVFVIWSLFQSRRLAVREKEIAKQRVDALLNNQDINNIETLLETQNKERNRIATELHDRMGSLLSAVKLNFSSIEDTYRAKEELSDHQIGLVKSLLDEAASEVRKISHDMASGVLKEFGLLRAVQKLKETIEASGKIKVNVFEHGFDADTVVKQEIRVYRIIQELISNALKHAKPSTIDIHLTLDHELLNLIVEDDGIGFEKSVKENPKQGMGLLNIRKRVEEVGGKLKIDSDPRSGTTIVIDIPDIELKTN